MNTILQGDVLEELRRMPSASVDAVLSDPPYGLAFLDLDWDKVLPPAEVWRELARVTKPGANVLLFGGARTHHRLMVALEDAGFRVVDVLVWMHLQGFPKSRGGLKPAHEPIVLARAPGRAPPVPLNIDGCRIDGGRGRQPPGRPGGKARDTSRGATSFRIKSGPAGGDARGRWPANLIMDEAVAEKVDAAYGKRRSGAMHLGRTRSPSESYGGAFRWGGTAATTDIERAASERGISSAFFCPKVKGHTRAHPTQKPIELTEWLAKLLLVPDGRLLVPYAGVGSEMVGAVAGGWSEVVGIESNPGYVTIAEGRLAAMGAPALPVVRAPALTPRRRVVRDARDACDARPLPIAGMLSAQSEGTDDSR